MLNIKIREPKISEASELALFNNTLFNENPSFLIPIVDVFTRENQIFFIEKFKQTKNALLLVAVFEKKIIGTLDFMPSTNPNKIHIGRLGLMVHKEFRNKGIASKLFKYLLESIQSTNIKKIEVECIETNKAILCFNIKHNFLYEGRKSNSIFINNRYQNIIQMAYEL